MGNNLEPTDLVNAVNGDLDALSVILESPHQVILETRERLPGLTLSAKGVLRVLASLRRGRVLPGKVQQWASFVRRGYRSRQGEMIIPIDIDYDPIFEDQIAYVVSRLDEIGDTIDGIISTEELENMIHTLSIS